MKVERKKGFMPITITLETYEEARQMWHHLNVGGLTVEKYAEDEGDRSFEASDHLYDKFTDVFTPNEIE